MQAISSVAKLAESLIGSIVFIACCARCLRQFILQVFRLGFPCTLPLPTFRYFGRFIRSLLAFVHLAPSAGTNAPPPCTSMLVRDPMLPSKGYSHLVCFAGIAVLAFPWHPYLWHVHEASGTQHGSRPRGIDVGLCWTGEHVESRVLPVVGWVLNACTV